MVIQQFKYEHRPCECCGSDQLELLHKFDYTAHTSGKKWQFSVNDVICKKCGFVFVSPSPLQDQLLDYYADTFAKFQGQMVDFSSTRRIEYIQKWVTSEFRKTFLEVGAHHRTSFHYELQQIFEEVITIEPNADVNGDFNRLDKFRKQQMDVVAHYFVLEHVPDVTVFVQQCYDYLKPGGFMICEVPDLLLYPKDISALILHEHVNHFTPETLTQICAKIGFRKVDHSHSNCSRSFGFVIVFEKKPTDSIRREITQYVQNKTAFNDGLHVASVFMDKKKHILQVIEERKRRNENVLIWGANDNLLRMFTGEEIIPDNVVIVDSNPKKKDFLSNGKVKLPEDIKGILKDISVIVLMTNLHAVSILNTLNETYHKTFSKSNVHIFDYYDPLR